MDLQCLGRAVLGELPSVTYNSILVQSFIDGIRETCYYYYYYVWGEIYCNPVGIFCHLQSL